MKSSTPSRRCSLSRRRSGTLSSREFGNGNSRSQLWQDCRCSGLCSSPLLTHSVTLSHTTPSTPTSYEKNSRHQWSTGSRATAVGSLVEDRNWKIYGVEYEFRGIFASLLQLRRARIAERMRALQEVVASCNKLRRERIAKRMRALQEVVPSCNKSYGIKIGYGGISRPFGVRDGSSSQGGGCYS
ncbi:hypothetical protein RHMOL_Rhmol09G0177800 [Rhododendron molle]|uniref:Uncharacterized protein n=1 Tax=Rhododendron molle TaxID=49168 RepID=A0ACC0MFU2_RHOML|nr:hypothetical protein RHMOL_Rhmol09G0177800 [Rhododendron molle]